MSFGLVRASLGHPVLFTVTVPFSKAPGLRHLKVPFLRIRPTALEMWLRTAAFFCTDVSFSTLSSHESLRHKLL
ncbi:hypothetical protein SRHO_G00302780 [Serrasalmus rhombeus]